MTNKYEYGVPSGVPQNEIWPSPHREVAEVRWCYYLHLDKAKMHLTLKWTADDKQNHPVFLVEGKRRPVLIRAYFESVYGTKWCLIYAMTTKACRRDGKRKPNLKRLGPLSQGSSTETYINTIPDRYPVSLIEMDRSKPPAGFDPTAIISICRILDDSSYRSP